MEKGFEAIEKIAINMADTVWPDYDHKKKVGKLEEEFRELIEAFCSMGFKDEDTGEVTIVKATGLRNQKELDMEHVKDEMGDVLFVLTHIANRMGFTMAELLHHASTKLLRRIQDPSYNKD